MRTRNWHTSLEARAILRSTLICVKLEKSKAARLRSEGTLSVCDADDERQGEKPRANREEIGAVELSQKLTAAVDTWAANRHITRADAIRRLVELGLHAKPH